MFILTAQQIKAARAILDLSREALADATGLSVATIRNLETGYISYRSSEVIRQAIENKGWEFTSDEGIRRRTSEISVINGADCPDILFGDIIQTVRETQSNVVAILDSQDLFVSSLGGTESNGEERIKKIRTLSEIKCIVTKESRALLLIPQIEFKALSKHHTGNTSCFVYGNKVVQVFPEKSGGLTFIIFNSVDYAQESKLRFDRLWQDAAAFILLSGKEDIPPSLHR